MKKYIMIDFWWRFLTFIIDIIMSLLVWIILWFLLWNSKYEFHDGDWYGRWQFFNLFEYKTKWFGVDLTGAEKFGWIVILFLFILYVVNFIWYLKKGKNISQSICKIEILNKDNLEELNKKELWKRYFYKFLNLYLVIIFLLMLTVISAIKGGREGAGYLFLFLGSISFIIYLIILFINMLKISLSEKKESWYDKKSQTILVRKK